MRFSDKLRLPRRIRALLQLFSVGRCAIMNEIECISAYRRRFMADISKFRSALGGFNREDVVNYIESMSLEQQKQLRKL